MRVLYDQGQITDISVNNETLQTRMTRAERMHVWGPLCDAALGIATNHLETNNANIGQGTPVTLAIVVDLMVVKGLITLQRGNELKA